MIIINRILYNRYILNKYYNYYRNSSRYTTIQIGDSSNDVIILQDKLRLLGYYFLSITSNFDKNTENSVKLFQEKNNLPITGIVDDKTWELLYNQTSLPTPKIVNNNVLKLGDTGNEVKILQEKLTILTYYLFEINSLFDKNTEIAVKQFQLNNFLTADGIVGNNTLNRINMLYEPLSKCDEFTLPENTGTYIVQKGDTLYSISKKFNTTVDELKSLNNLTSNLLNLGDILNIVKSTVPEITSYSVIKGDTLYSIAKKFNTTVNNIKNFNNLTSDILSIGQILNLTANSTPSVNTYIVKKGDTLYSIAKKLDTTVELLKKLNNLTSSTLSINQSLLLPPG